MIVRADRTYPGDRYTDSAGNVLEPILDQKALRDRGLLKVRRSRDGRYQFYMISDAGKRVLSPKFPGKLWIGDYMWHHLVDDGVIKAPRRPGRSGPAPRGEQKWRGWVLRRPEFCEGLLEAVVAGGGFVLPTPHYFRLGLHGTTFAALFRNGMLGFTDVPEDLRDYAIERQRGGTVPQRGYKDNRIILEAVVILREQREFVLRFVSAFRRFSAETRKAVKL